MFNCLMCYYFVLLTVQKLQKYDFFSKPANKVCKSLIYKAVLRGRKVRIFFVREPEKGPKTPVCNVLIVSV